MLSRVAESLFWMSRNMQRAEALARVVDVAFNRTIDRNVANREQVTAIWRGVLGLAGIAESEDAFAAVTFAPEHPSSILSCIHVARQNAANVRAEISTEVWESVNALYLYIEGKSAKAVMRAGPSSFLRQVRDAGVTFGGIVDATLAHDEAWNFIHIGRFLERGAMTAAILQTRDPGDNSVPEWQRILEMACASEPFARALRHSQDPRDALAFLLMNESFPRSVRYCAVQVDRALHRLSGAPLGSFSNPAERRSGRLASLLAYVEGSEIVEEGALNFSRRLSSRFAQLGSAIEATYFPLVPAA